MNIPFSEQAMTLACRFSTIEGSLSSATKPHTFCQLLKNFLETIRAEDPTTFHYDISRTTLTHIDKEALKNEQSVDMLARELVKACLLLDEQIKFPTSFAKLIKRDQAIPGDPYLLIVELPKTLSTLDEQFFSSDGLTLWDSAYLKLLQNIGITGKKQSIALTKEFVSRDKKWDARFWFKEQDLEDGVHFFHSPAFLGLAAVLWEDIVKNRVKFARENVSSLSTNIHVPIRKVLSPKTELLVSENHKQYQLINGSELAAMIEVPTIPAHLLHLVLRGVPKLHSLYGHRIFRYEVQEPFRKMVAGESDYRVIKLDSGQSELAEILGFKGKKAVTFVGEILHAQAYLHFKHKGISGNLIQLTKVKSPFTGRDDSLEITVGTMLLPYQTFEAYKNGDCGLLIPLLKDPPLVGANFFHANLYSLQMDVMAEFSKQSIELYKTGCITISNTKWQELCYHNAIPPELGERVLNRWINDADDGSKFLELVQDSQYTLGSEYAKELAFLKEQGQRRSQASVAGKISSQSKKPLRPKHKK